MVSVDLGSGPVPPARLADAIQADLGSALAAHLASDGLDPAPLGTRGVGAADDPRCRRRLAFGPDAPLATVVVATCRRADQLPRCLDAVLASRYPHFEVLVVDNDPEDPSTRQVVESRYRDDRRVRYLREWVPGLSRARNLGYQFSRGEIVVFTDDDVRVDPDWLGALVAAMAEEPAAACVTGLVVAAELDTEAQCHFEDAIGLAKGMERRVFDLDDHADPTPVYPFAAGRFGTGAYLAVRKALLGDLWGFDVNLGVGSLACGGEDLDCFVDLLYQGHRIVYEPRALLWHYHHRTDAEYQSKLVLYGRGLGAYLTKQLVVGRGGRRELLRRLPAGVRFALRPGSRHDPRAKAGGGAAARRREVWGIASGPWAYARSRIHNAWLTA
jgi:glycosyltransferase involved in cell wall biosynthesis